MIPPGAKPLTEDDFDRLAGIDRYIIEQAGLQRVDSFEGGQIVGRNGRGDYSGIIFPYCWPGDSHAREYRLRRDHPEMESDAHGKLKPKDKYLSPSGRGNLLYFPPGIHPEWLADAKVPIAITEGEKKTLALHGLAWHDLSDTADHPGWVSIGVAGAWNWKGTVGKTETADGVRVDVKGVIPDFNRIEWKGRVVKIIFDANVHSNEKVEWARNSLAAELRKRGAIVSLVDIPESAGVNGVDDLVGVWGKQKVLDLINASKAEAATETPLSLSRQDLPLIDVANRQLRDKTADCLAALEAANNPPFLFTQDDKIVRIQYQGLPERKVIAEVGQDALRGCLTRAANFRQPNPRKKGQFIQVPPPMDCVLDILTLPPTEWKFPPLLSIVESPVLRPDGSILDKPGYDPSTKLFYAPTNGLDIRVKEFPTQDDAHQAAQCIAEVMEGFPFADERASRANMLSAFLSPICRPAFDGSIPMGLFNGTTMGTGKTLATECVGLVANGRVNSLTPAPTDQSEWRKKITSILLERPSLVVFDNINHRLDSPDLCLALTGESYSDRILGISKNANVPIQWCCLGTGNNLQLGGDMARRAYWVNLDAKCSKPFQRSGFKHPDLKRWVLEHRGELLSALLTMARAWFVAGKPSAPAHPFGGFQGWTDTIGGILYHAGVEGFLENDDQLFEQADIETLQWESFLLTLHELFCGEPFLCSEIVEKIQAKTYNEEARTTELTASASRLIALLPDSVAEVADKPKSLPRKIGNQFRERIGRRFGNTGAYLERGDIVHNAQQWIVRGVSED